jgi:hypothetical protein
MFSSGSLRPHSLRLFRLTSLRQVQIYKIFGVAAGTQQIREAQASRQGAYAFPSKALESLDHGRWQAEPT